MAKLTLNTINGSYASNTLLNDNFNAIEQALENTLSRDGTVPNSMLAPLDMNNQDILNVNNLDVKGVLSANGQNVSAPSSALMWRGGWNSGTSYNESDGVTYNGSSYICLTAHTNSPPPSVRWDVLAEKGTSGSGSGDVSGPVSAVSSNLAIFNGVSGTIIADSGIHSSTVLVDGDVGTTVQGYDADTAKTDVEQTWSQVQRTNESIGTSLTLDLDAGYLDFRCTPAAGGALTFSNIPASPLVQKGTIRFINGSNYAITAAASTKINTSDLSKISATGTYLLSYRTSDGNVYVVSSSNVA